MRRRDRRQAERDDLPLHRLAMGWTTRQDGTLTQRERRLLRRNGRPVEHPHERTRRLIAEARAAGRLPSSVTRVYGGRKIA